MKLYARPPVLPPVALSCRRLPPWSRVGGILLLLLLGLWVDAAANPAEAKYASMVVDAETGEVLHAVNADAQNYPASLTKMMTLYLLFDELDRGHVHLDDEIPVSAHAAAQAPSKLGLQPGQTLEVKDAVLGLVTKSANDAAVAVGEFLGGSEPAFAELMTRKAHELGMRQTQFRNASGLPNLAQHSSARDMVTLARALLRNHPNQYHWFSTRQFVYNGQVMTTHNHMMTEYAGADGIKTGYIAASGFNLVASVKRDGRRLIGVVFGGESAAARDRHMMALLDAAFARPAGSGTELASLPEQNGADEEAEPPASHKPAKATKAVAEKEDDEEDAEVPAVMKAMAHAQPVVKAAPAAHPPAKKAAATGDSDDEEAWGIQVGAYAQAAKARLTAAEARHKLGKLLADGDIDVIRAKDKMFRARVVGLSQQTAREACRQLAHDHSACAVINTGIDVASR